MWTSDRETSAAEYDFPSGQRRSSESLSPQLGTSSRLFLKDVGAGAVVLAGGLAVRNVPALCDGVITVRAFSGRQGGYLVTVGLGEVLGHHQ